MKRVFAVLSVLAAAIALSAFAAADTSTAIFAYTPGVGIPGQLILDGNSVEASFTGWWDQTGSHSASNPNYIAGICGSSDGCFGNDTDHHNFFVFNIPSGTYSTATLRIYNPGVVNGDFADGYICPCGSLTYQSWDVTTGIADLEATGSGQVGIYDDLASGILYGWVAVTAASDGTYVDITLNADALAAINAAAGAQWAVGGNTVIPEPGTLTLLGTSLLAGAGLLRRKLL